MLRAMLCTAVLFVGCGPGSPGGPTMNNRLSDDPMPVGPPPQSNDILARQGTASRVMVKHVLIGWRGRGQSVSTRTREQADDLAENLIGQLRSGAPIEALMATHSEDTATARSGEAIEVTATAELVEEFRRLSLRLEVGEAGVVLTEFGWHVVQRVE